MRKIQYEIPAEYSERPLLHFLKGHLNLSANIIKSLRHTPQSVFINGTPSRVIDKVFCDDTVTLIYPEKTNAPLLWDTPIDILYEDEDLLVVNKPSGVSSHPTYNHPNFTLSNAVASYMQKTYNTSSAARAIGRLDKVTSGVMIFSKNALCAWKLNGHMDKTYHAVVWGELHDCGTVDAPIYRPDFNKTVRAVGENGDNAITNWEALASAEGKSFLKIRTLTGRTHQIRVHMAHIGHPLLGDEMYGGEATEWVKRACLHCTSITVIHPVKNEEMTFIAPFPEDIKKELEKSGLTVDKQKLFC